MPTPSPATRAKSHGALVSQVWAMALPPVRYVSAAHVRHVLLRLVEYTNPRRDKGALYAWPAVASLAEGCGMHERQVQRVLQALRAAGILEEVLPGLRAGRSRKPQPAHYRLQLDKPTEPDAPSLNGGVVGVATIGNGGVVGVATNGAAGDNPGDKLCTGVSLETLPLNGGVVRVAPMAMVATPATPEPGNSGEPVNTGAEPGNSRRASARGHDDEDGKKEPSSSGMHMLDGYCPACGNPVQGSGEGHRTWPRRCPFAGLTVAQTWAEYRHEPGANEPEEASDGEGEG